MDDRLLTKSQNGLDPRPPYGRQHTETGAEARQGPLGRPILYVLVAGLILAAIYFIGTQIWSVSEDLPPAGEVIDSVPPAAAPGATPAAAPATP